MTEQEWLKCTDLWPMLDHLQDRARSRKSRLFACACCQRISRLFHDKRLHQLLAMMEQFADGLVDESYFNACQTEAINAENALEEATAPWEASAALTIASFDDLPEMFNRIFDAIRAEHDDRPSPKTGRDLREEFHELTDKEHTLYVHLLRDIFGNPFRPVTLDPRWLSSTVLDLARTIYEERAFERMPILADALMDAGCDSDEIINHCRSDGPHVRGCWVVDLLLSKE